MTYWVRSFDGIPECVSEVREYTRKVLNDCRGADAVELVASELASNAIRHSDSGAPGGQFTVRLEEFVDRWQVRVDDEGGPRVPHVCLSPQIESVDDLDKFGDDVEVGRGLALVATVSSGWGVLGDKNARAVWAEVLMPAEATA